MPAKEYAERAAGLEEELSSLAAVEQKLNHELSHVLKEYRKTEEDMRQVIRFVHMQELTQEAVDTFIRKILVYRDKRVESEWNFQSGRVTSSAETRFFAKLDEIR